MRESEEEIIDEAGCDSSHGKREDKKSKKEKEKTDEGKAHAKCKNGCQCEPIKEGEETATDETETLEEGEKLGYYDAKDYCAKCCDKPGHNFSTGMPMTRDENYEACMKRHGHGPGMKPSNTAPRGAPKPSDQSDLTYRSRSDYRNQSYGLEESKVMTVEKEKALKENYMGEKRNRLFEKLTKKWTK